MHASFRWYDTRFINNEMRIHLLAVANEYLNDTKATARMAALEVRRDRSYV